MNFDEKFDYIKGSLLGGAIGDALGYPVEFLHESDIVAKYGNNGITQYDLKYGDVAVVSDDTQMTMFTAKGILIGKMRGYRKGIKGKDRIYVYYAYLDWLHTQNNPFVAGDHSYPSGNELLMDIKELYSRRAPGMTCLSALAEYLNNKEKPIEDYISLKVNNSKGCGGIMRVAPLALTYDTDILALDEEAAQISAITHGHPLGYIPSAVLNHIINRIVFHNEEGDSLEDIVLDAIASVEKIFCSKEYAEHIDYMNKLVRLALKLSKNDDSDVDNIHQLGEGWVAEEALAIAVYCAVRYQNDFSKAIITAVNHNGDSDSTGAICGNIVGAMVGYDAIDEKWKNNLEMKDNLLDLAKSLCYAWR